MTALPPASVGVLSNPASGHNKTQFAAVNQRLARCPQVIHLPTHSAAEIPAALRQLRAADIRLLAINGGDGTVSAVLGQLLESGIFDPLPKVLILPGGTANMNAGDIGVSGSLQSAVERFCRWCENTGERKPEQLQRSLLKVAVDTTSAAHYGMFLGGGAIIHGTEYAHREIHARGLRDDFSLVLGVIRTVWGVVRQDPEFSGHQRLGISLDGGPGCDHDSLILAISTLERLAFGMRPFWGTGPGLLRVTLMEQGCSKFVRTFARIVRGKPGPNAIPAEGYFSHNANTVSLLMEGKLNLDGEILEVANSAEICASPPLEFIRL